MKSSYYLCWLFISLFFISNGYGQSTTYKGRVYDENNVPLKDASVVNKRTQKTVLTNGNGQFELAAAFNDVLLCSYVGFQNKEIILNKENAEMGLVFKLQAISNVLNDVIVTAAGIKRSKKTLGYSVQEIKGEELLRSGEVNMVTALAGKVAGVQVSSSSGAVGGVAQIRVRGSASLTGNNSPLFVIDGIPIDNSQSRSQLQGDINGGVSQSSRGVDINPNDIENLVVLKGPAATALYGIRAASGAVIITTKSGKKKDGEGKVYFSSNYSISEQNGYQKMQEKYAQGTEVGNLLPQYRDPSSGSVNGFGPDVSLLSYSNSPSPFNSQGKIVLKSDPTSNNTPVNVYDNVGAFLVKGTQFENYVSLSNANEKSSFFVSAGVLDQNGIIPTENFKRKSVKITGKSFLTDLLSFTASATYTNSTGNRVQQGSNSSGVMASLLREVSTFDITNGYKNPLNQPLAYSLTDGGQRNSGGNIGGRDNPFWSVNKNQYLDNVDRIIGFTEINYKITPWLNAMGRIGLDMFNESRKESFSRFSRAIPLGAISEITSLNRNLTSDFILTANKKISPKFDVTFLLGHNYYDSYGRNQSISGNQLTIPGFDNVAGAAVLNGGAGIYRKKLNAAYSDLRISYSEWAFLNISGRNEWSSTLPANANSFFYPSVSLGADVTKALNIKSNVLDYWKLRASYGQVGNDAPIYALTSGYGIANATNTLYTSGIQFPFNGLLGLTLNDQAGNALLKPEVRVSTEFGGEFRFFKNRLSIDVTYYNSKSKNLIVSVPLPTSTGYTSSMQNAGEVTNNGWEVMLEAKIINKKDFKWTANLNWSANISKVTKIADGITSIGITGVGPLGQVRLVEGEQFGSFFGNDFLRNASGKVLIDDRQTLPNGTANINYGFPSQNPTPQVIGNPNPKWIAGLRNTFMYKNFTLSALLDVRYKFDVYNATLGTMNQSGTSLQTEDRYTPTVFDGVKQSDGKPNDISVIKGQRWYTGVGGGFGSGVHSQFVEDGTWLRMRDLSIGYTFNKIAQKIKIQNIEAGLTSRNLFLLTKYSGVDPEVNLNGDNNANGYDYFTIPNTRSFGVYLKVWF
jgi:TonB-linked SusC/RagA family outer membrane protein